ncbi:MAG: hypothetical protein QXL88_01530 [Candidatus Pacearchaeota archaeon]
MREPDEQRKKLDEAKERIWKKDYEGAYQSLLELYNKGKIENRIKKYSEMYLGHLKLLGPLIDISGTLENFLDKKIFREIELKHDELISLYIATERALKSILTEKERVLVELEYKAEVEGLRTYDTSSFCVSGNLEKLLDSYGLDDGTKDLVAVTIDKRESMQPCGVKIAELAKNKGIPFVITVDFYKGMVAALSSLSDLLVEKGFVSPSVDRELYEDSFVDNTLLRIRPSLPSGIECFPKSFKNYMCDSPKFWKKVLERFKKRMEEKERYRILLVENDSDAIESFDKVKCEFDIDTYIVNDVDSACAEIQTEKFDGIITDMFFPYKIGSKDKYIGKKICLEVMTEKTGRKKAEEILNKAQMLEEMFVQEVEKAYEKLSKILV